MPAKTHGEAHKTTEWRVWTKIKERCYNQNHVFYKNYGGRGIKVCERWLVSYLNFLEDMGRKPEGCTSIDRIDNDRDYCKENCRWSTDKEQANNRRSNKMLKYQGETLTMAQLADKIGMDQHTLAKRLRRGYSMEAAVAIPHGLRRANLSMTYNGQTKTLKEWAPALGISYSVLKERLKLGWTPEQIASTPTKIYH